MADGYKWGAAILGELGKIAEVAFDARRQGQGPTPRQRAKAKAERDEACTPCAVNARIADAKEKAKAFSRKTG